MGYIIERLRKSAEVWKNLIQLTGGTLALHKTHWRLLAWRLERGELKPLNATEEVITMEDGKGAHAVIDFVAPDEPNEGLGYYLCPDGNQGPTHASILQEMEDLSNRILSARLLEQEARQVLHQRLVPKLSYKLQLSTMTKKQCNNINTKIKTISISTDVFELKHARCSGIWP